MLNERKTVAIAVVLLINFSLAASATDTEWTFTTCGSSGGSGPSQSSCDSAYGSDIDVNVDSYGRQIWEVPATGEYTITAKGAEGGYHDSPRGGRGASITGDFELNKGDKLMILVGQMGQAVPRSSGGRAYAAGGGGSFVTKNNPSGESDILVIAGGGGSSVHQDSTNSAADGKTGECGGDGKGSSGGSGGCNGDAGSASGGSYTAYGGCGFSGTTSQCETFLDGGEGYQGYYDEEGGFGSGGSNSGSGSHARAAGGGGYSGGGGGRGTTSTSTGVSGGGGGSYNSGSNQDNTAGENRGHGTVTVKLKSPQISSPRPAETSGTGSVDTLDPNLKVDVSYASGKSVDYEFYSVDEGYIGTDTVDGSGTAEVEWSGRTNGETYQWYVKTGDGTVQTNIWEFTVDVSDPPQIDSVDFDDYTGEHAFNTSVKIYDPDGGSDVDNCEISFDGQNSGESRVVTVDADESYGGPKEAECNYSKISRSGGFEVLEPVDVDITVTDAFDESDTWAGSHTVPNNLPELSLVYPPDGETISDDPVPLEIYSEAKDDSDLRAWFFGDGNQLGSMHDFTDSASLQVDWAVVSGNKYDWSVKVSDGYENTTGAWSFYKTISKSYRVETGLIYRYSELVIPKGRTGYLEFQVENRISESKNLESSLSGVDAEFQENGGSQVSYTLDGHETKTFGIVVSPSTTGYQTLNVTTTNTDLETENIDSFPVYVNDPISRQEEVPGIGMLQLLVLTAMASTVYFIS